MAYRPIGPLFKLLQSLQKRDRFLVPPLPILLLLPSMGLHRNQSKTGNALKFMSA